MLITFVEVISYKIRNLLRLLNMQTKKVVLKISTITSIKSNIEHNAFTNLNINYNYYVHNFLEFDNLYSCKITNMAVKYSLEIEKSYIYSYTIL